MCSVDIACTCGIVFMQIYGLSSKLAPAIGYEYIIPKELENSLDIDADFGPPQTKYIWHLKGWTDCTETCGGGKQHFLRNFAFL